MRAFAVAVLIAGIAAAGAFAQRGGGPPGGGGRGGGPPGGGGHPGGGHPGISGGHPGIVLHTVPQFRTYGSPSGFGNILAPGVGTLPPLYINPFGSNAPFAERFGATISGYPGFGGGFYRGNFPLFPYAVYPGVYGGYPAPDPYAYGYQVPQPNVTVVVPPSQPPPEVNIYTGQSEGAQPMVREYGPRGEEYDPRGSSSVTTYRAPSPPRPEPAATEIRFLIPLKDSSIYTAVAYWVEGDMLHYITTDGRHNQVSLSLVDRSLAERLNRGSVAGFHLPPAR